MSEEQCYKTVAELFEKYKDNEYMMQRLVMQRIFLFQSHLMVDQMKVVLIAK